MTSNLDAWKKSADMRVDAAKSILDYYRGNIEAALTAINDVAFKDYTGE